MKIIADQNIPFVKECFSSLGEVQLVSGREVTPQLVRDADALLVRSITRVNAGLLENSRVRFVGTATIGMDHIDLEYLFQQGIGFSSAPGSNANSVAEYVIAGILDVSAKMEIDVSDSLIGIIGVGNVGSQVEQKARALGMHVYLNDPPLERQTKDPKYLPIEKLFECDFLTVHTPLTFDGLDKTHHLVNEYFFDQIKTRSVFINTSRGGVMDSPAVKNAIQSGKIRAAILDVWENEPQIDTELLEMTQIGTPHIAGYSYDGKVSGMIMIYRAFCEHFDLKPAHDAGDFLPKPEVESIQIDKQNLSCQETLKKCVEQVYPIRRDDTNLRKMTDLILDEQGAYFDRLRKEYPIRREFRNTVIRLTQADMELKDKLTGIGFHVE